MLLYTPETHKGTNQEMTLLSPTLRTGIEIATTSVHSVSQYEENYNLF